MLETSTKLQRQVFALIEKKHPLGKKWLLDYMEWSGLKKSAAYNHRNGTTAMTADDVLRLMSHYRSIGYGKTCFFCKSKGRCGGL